MVSWRGKGEDAKSSSIERPMRESATPRLGHVRSTCGGPCGSLQRLLAGLHVPTQARGQEVSAVGGKISVIL